MHDGGFRKAYGFSAKPFNPCTDGEVFSLYRLGVFFADCMPLRFNVASVTSPIVRIEHRDSKRFQHAFQLAEHLVFSLAERICQNNMGVVVYRQPKPALVPFVLYEAPHLVKLRRLDLPPKYQVGFQTLGRDAFYVLDIDSTYCSSRFFKVSDTFCLDIFKTLAVSRIPEALAAIWIIISSIPGLLPLYLYSCLNDLPGHSLLLHRYLWSPFSVFPLCDIFVLLHIGHLTCVIAIGHTSFLCYSIILTG